MIELMKNVVVVLVGREREREREIVDWTLSKMAGSGDCVIALHITSLPPQHPRKGKVAVSDRENEAVSSISAMFEEIRSIKDIVVQVKEVIGSSLRRTLVEEAKLCSATKLIIGAPVKHFSLGSTSLSVAKYCYKRLPPSCSVLVVRGLGKIIFQKEGIEKSSITNKSLISVKIQIQKDPSHHAQSNVITCISSNLERRISQSGCSDSTCADSGIISLCSSSRSSFNISPNSSVIAKPSDIPLCLNSSEVEKGSFEAPRGLSLSGNDNLSLSDLMEHNNMSYTSIVPEASQGWPLCHRSLSLNKVTNPYRRARRMSVIEWALQLPDRRKEGFDEMGNSARLDQLISANQLGYWSNDQISDGKNTEVKAIERVLSSSDRQNSDLSQQTSSLYCDQLEHVEECVQPLPERLENLQKSSSIVRFDFEDLKEATSNFSTEKFLGKGGCSEVFQGTLQDGRLVAVKRLNPKIPDAELEIVTEVEILGVLQHPHIAVLVGYCFDSQNYILVYNFVPKGNLENCLHAANEKLTLPWEVRLKVAIGVARALDYLHDGCLRPVIHRDVKSSNILLSSDFEPQLTDFGLAKWAPASSSHLTCSNVVGTFGYLAPEYFMYGRVSEKTDVYSFGVVLLELLTGRKAIDTTKPKGQENLVMWARPILEGGNYVDLVDPKLLLEEEADLNQMRNMMLTASACLRRSAQCRPRMKWVLKLLRGEEEESMGPPQMESDEGYDMVPSQHGDCDIHSHLRLALLGLDDDVASQDSTTEHSLDLGLSQNFLEDYLAGRYSRSSSFEQ